MANHLTDPPYVCMSNGLCNHVKTGLLMAMEISAPITLILAASFFAVECEFQY